MVSISPEGRMRCSSLNSKTFESENPFCIPYSMNDKIHPFTHPAPKQKPLYTNQTNPQPKTKSPSASTLYHQETHPQIHPHNIRPRPPLAHHQHPTPHLPPLQTRLLPQIHRLHQNLPTQHAALPSALEYQCPQM